MPHFRCQERASTAITEGAVFQCNDARPGAAEQDERDGLVEKAAEIGRVGRGVQ